MMFAAIGTLHNTINNELEGGGLTKKRQLLITAATQGKHFFP